MFICGFVIGWGKTAVLPIHPVVHHLSSVVENGRSKNVLTTPPNPATIPSH
ncbi:MAG: hypothetical protein KC423_05965 [Anaerolineales bacterium]|nr:hypothetical protein [Anaerolineales bacterium]